MQELLTGTSIFALLMVAILTLSAVFMPLFVIICASRLKTANDTLKRVERLLAAQGRR
tara:strand:+ start:1581 stop:1754 length:174 start_codon:yes stop_codon:yes gene_type:complete